MSIFRKYDIRGEYPSEIDEDKAEQIAKAFADLKNLSGKKVAAGMDCRNSSPSLKEAVVEGLTDQGCKVIDIGLTATPILYYEVVEDDLSGGLMVTASHNPKEDNGIRLCGSMGLDLTYDSGIGEIEERYSGEFKPKSGGKIIQKDVKEDFKEKILSKIDISSDFKVVLDPGNGSAALIAEDLFSSLGCETKIINSQLDGNFPGRGPDPTEDIGNLGDTVTQENADLGIAFDGDSDRGIFVDEKGKKVESDMILSLFVENFIDSGDTVIHDVTCSKALEDVIKDKNARDIQFRVGMNYIKREMVKREAKLAGEYSGHFFFKENDYYDDPFFAAGKLLEIMDKKGKLSRLVDELPQYYSKPEMRIECSNKEEIPEKIKEEFSDRRIVDIDGAKVYFDKGWALVRPSGTEEKISVRFEAENEEALEEIKEQIMPKVEESTEL